MSWALFAAAAVVALIWTLTLRLSVRVVANKADNGWDNAIGYGVVTLLLGVPLRWFFGTHSVLLIALSPLLIWGAQVLALKWIYELRPLHAWLLGMVHGLISTFFIGTVTVAAGAVAAYVIYGRIVADPMILVRLILRLIGIELPI
ncbi:MAG: hypothetical protein KC933_37995 [Myxococcales bacterium]|nr:hypothetical protein [Myxococcales bacterium]